MITLPSQPKPLQESDNVGVYEISALYPGYGDTIGNSLRRIILSSLPGAAITAVKIKGASHEFSTLEGVKEDVLRIILNLKKVRFAITGDEPVVLQLKMKGEKAVTAADINETGGVTIANPDQHIATLTTAKAELDMELHVSQGIGYVPREDQTEVTDSALITLDAIFTPVRNVAFTKENMRVGDRTDFNKLAITIETDGTISPREALQQSVVIFMQQMGAIANVQEDSFIMPADGVREDDDDVVTETTPTETTSDVVDDSEVRKTRVEALDISQRIYKVLEQASIRTVGGLVSKTREDLQAIDGLGEKAVEEIEVALKDLNVSLKES